MVTTRWGRFLSLVSRQTEDWGWLVFIENDIAKDSNAGSALMIEAPLTGQFRDETVFRSPSASRRLRSNLEIRRAGVKVQAALEFLAIETGGFHVAIHDRTRAVPVAHRDVTL